VGAIDDKGLVVMLVSTVHPWCDRPDDAQSWRGSPYNRGWMIRNPVRDVTRIISQTSEQLILERRPNDVAKTNRRTILANLGRHDQPVSEKLIDRIGN
jgi:hypothetical protein